jgi:hypothetical protein
MCVCVCVCARACMRVRACACVQNVPLDLSANCYECHDHKLCLTKTITNNIVNFQMCIASTNCCVTKQHMRKICP